MALIKTLPNTTEKLALLSRDSQYDLACSCGTSDTGRRHRSKDDKWIYPVTLPHGGKVFLFKTLVSNHCVNNCKYCPLRTGRDQERCTLDIGELVNYFLQYYRKGRVSGIFLSSGVMGTPDKTMEKINGIARVLRNMRFRGYMHLKIIPGASDAAIKETVSLASAVSVNIESPGEDNFKTLCSDKNYLRDVIRPIRLISALTETGSAYSSVKQTTQFVVGASNETDGEIIRYSWDLYKNLRLNRIYFSAYQRGTGEPNLPAEISGRSNADMLTREHRLYQVDWLIRKYGFTAEEIPFEHDGNLSLTIDPKEMWAIKHPEFFPVNINKADHHTLMRIPGFGDITVNRILNLRKSGVKARSLEYLGKTGKRLGKAEKYVTF